MPEQDASINREPLDHHFVQRVNLALLALEEIDPVCGAAVRLHDVEGLPSDEVAAELQVPEEFARQRVFLGRRCMLRILDSI